MVHLPSFAEVWPLALGTLACVLLLSGLEDLLPTLTCAFHHLFGKATERPAPEPISERRIAIFVPCWKEAGVIAHMVRHNIASLRYHNYDFFLGVYPNDPDTLQVVRQLAATFRRVHVAVCPNPGPTSKADCLNAIYHAMRADEAEVGVAFDTVVLHDAEDIIHPAAFALINRERSRYDMVQVPVLPLPTPVSEFTHGVYCDDFAEFQIIDMRARQLCKSFIPLNGVGTGFSREILDRLAEERNGVVFHPASLTEDYEIGVYAHNSGFKQLFAPLKRVKGDFCVTREYFPRRVKSAVRQRTRWVTGICLQSWARDGWRGSWRAKYWFWRDRKGLLANPLSLLTNVLFLCGAASCVQAAVEHRPWPLAVANPFVLRLCFANSLLQAARLSLRMLYTGRIYGFAFAFAVPLRAFHGNLINCCASFGAIWQFAEARRQNRDIVWLKTEHAYPGRDAVVPVAQDLADVLIGGAYLPAAEIDAVQQQLRSDAYLAQVLLERGLISEENLCAAISLQSGVPFTRLDVRTINRKVVRTLPSQMERRFGVVPFGVDSGRLFVAGARVPSTSMYEELKRFTQLPIEFYLITRRNYEELRSLL